MAVVPAASVATHMRCGCVPSADDRSVCGAGTEASAGASTAVRMHSERRQRCSQEQNTAEGMEAGGAGICGNGGDIGASGAGGAPMTAVRTVQVLEQTHK